VQTVLLWLKSKKLKSWVDAFEELDNDDIGVDGKVLLSLDEDSLKEDFTCMRAIARKKLLAEVAALRCQSDTSSNLKDSVRLLEALFAQHLRIMTHIGYNEFHAFCTHSVFSCM